MYVDYGGESVFVSFRVDVYAQPAERFGFSTTSDLSSYTLSANLWTDIVYIGRVPNTSTYFIVDNPSSATFDTPQTRVLQDLDRDGIIFDTRGEVQTSANDRIMAGEEVWQVISISASGREVRISPAGKGVLSGRVQTFIGAKGIEGATIRVWPGPFETVSQSDGS